MQEKTPSEKKKAKFLVLDMIAVADGHIRSSSSSLHTFVLPGFNPFNPTVQDEYDKIFAQKKEPSALPWHEGPQMEAGSCFERPWRLD